jgi:peptidyl-prolyl cis-trans isomerase D
MAGVINRIRSRAGLMLGVIGLAMFAFIAQDLLSSLGGIFGSGRQDPDHMATVHGKKLSSEYVRARIQFEEQLQTLITDQPMDANQREQLEPMVWNQVLRDIVMGREFEALGLFDSDAKRWQSRPDYSMLISKLTNFQYQEAFFGANPVQPIKDNFQTGARFYEMLTMQNPENREDIAVYKNRLEAYKISLERQHIQTAYQSLLRAAAKVSLAQARQDYMEQNTRYDIDYLSVNYSALPDSAYKASEDEMRKYYDQHMERFRQEQNEAEVQLVTFEQVATRRDTLLALQYLENLKPTFAAAANDSLFAASRSRSTIPPVLGWQNVEQLTPDLRELIAGKPAGTIIGPVKVDNTFRMVKVGDTRQVTDNPYVKVRVLMVRPRGQSPQDSVEAVTRANKLREEVTPQTFEVMVMDPRNDEPNKMYTRGDMGWYTYGSLGQEVDAALRAAKAGSIVGPVRTPQGYYIFEVQQRSTNAIRLATIFKDVEAEQATLDSLKRLADGLIGTAMRENKPFEELAKSMGYRVISAPGVSSGASFIAGGLRGPAAKEVVSWALGKAKAEGEVKGEVVQTDNAYVVVYLKKRYERGYRPLNQVREEVQARVIEQKKSDDILKKLTKVPADTSLARMAQAYGPGAFAASAQGLTFASPGIQGLPDPILIGNLVRLKEGETSKPIVGKTGVYVVRVRKLTTPGEVTNEVVENHRKMLENRLRSSYPERAIQGLIKHAEVEDYRYNF